MQDEPVFGELRGKVAVVTGAASGIGAAAAAALAAAGAKVACADLNLDGAQEIAANLITRGGEALAVPLDVSDPACWQELAGVVERRFLHCDILANCAGIGSYAAAETVTPEEWRRVHGVNLDGPLYGIQTLMPLLKNSEGAAIINISSTSARIGATFGAAYSTSKAALVALTKSTAKYCNFKRYNIRCNVILPGHVETPLLEATLQKLRDPDAAKAQALKGLYQRRASSAEEIAQSVLFLASARSGNMTGGEIIIDGGLLA